MKFRFFLICIISVVICFGQTTQTKKQITDLKNGILFVRLSTREKTVEDLKKMGKTRAAEEIRNEQEIKNKKIVEAFKTNFKFCEYSFFYSQYSNEIQNRNFKFMIFDKDLKPDSDFNLNGRPFFVAEFGVLQADTARTFRDTKLQSTANFNVESTPIYSQNSPNKIYALIIKDNNYVQLKYPFPYYVNAYNTDRAVRKMNQKLNSFYNKSFK